MAKFEVGKKYKRDDSAYSEYTYMCLWTDGKWAILRDQHENDPLLSKSAHLYHEYKEPRCLKLKAIIWETANGKVVMGNTCEVVHEAYHIGYVDSWSKSKIIDITDVVWTEKV